MTGQCWQLVVAVSEILDEIPSRFLLCRIAGDIVRCVAAEAE